MTRRSVVVVGGGLAGLAAAWELTGGAEGPTEATPVVEVIEATPRLGGALQRTTLGGHVVDLGADGFLATRGEGVEFVTALGAQAHLTPIAASGASVYLSGHLEPLPTGLVLGVPTRWRQVRTLKGLSGAAKRGALRDLLWPRRLTIGDDATIGAIVRGKFGNALVDELIEPMIGGIQAGRVDDLSAADVFPGLLAAAKKGGSLMRAIRPPADAPRPSGPLFYSLDEGLASLPLRVADVLQRRGVVFSLGEDVTAIRNTPDDDYPLVVETRLRATPANAVVVATPPQVAGRLLEHFDGAFRQLSAMTSAGAVMVTLRVPRDGATLPASGTGVLVPLHTPFRDGATHLITAVTFLDRKWPRLEQPDEYLVRVHAGRVDDHRALDLDDSGLVARVVDELRAVFGSWPEPTEVYVQRWPAALPQYYVNHRLRVRAARDAAARHGLYLGGMAYDGVGVPASIGSGRAAGRAALERLNR